MKAEALAIPGVSMSREEAESLSRAMNECQYILVRRIGAFQRKRSWTDAQKAMEVGKARAALERLRKFNEELCKAHEIAGY